MNKCHNPECLKEIPEGKKYCNDACLKRHLEIKKASKLANEEDVWLGQERRKRATDIIMKLAKELLPAPYDQFSCMVSYRTGISLRKITDDYLHVLLGIGLLEIHENMLTLKGS